MFAKIPFAQPQYGIHQKFEKSEILVTKNDNRLGANADVLGMSNILVAGRTTIEKSTTIRGDLDRISIGKNCVIAEGAVLRPSDKLANDDTKDQIEELKLGIKFLPMSIGDFVVVGKSSVVRAAAIGNYVYIGDSCIIQQRCVLDSCSMLLPNTILAQGTVVPPFMVYGGVPGRCVGRLPPSFQHEMEEMCREFHRSVSQRESTKRDMKKPSSSRKPGAMRKPVGATKPGASRRLQPAAARTQVGRDTRSRSRGYSRNDRSPQGGRRAKPTGPEK